MENGFTEKLLIDTLEDMKTERKFLKKLCSFLCVFIVLLILGITGTSIYNQHKLFKFMNETEISSDIEINNDNSTNYGNITRN